MWWAVAAAALAMAGCARAPAEGPPNLLLVTVDTLRADRLGCYGGDDGVSPAIDALAEDGVRFTRAISQASWTLPSMATVHTSLHPSRHGATTIRSRLADEHDTVAEALQDAGYHTMGVVSHVLVNGTRGFDRGFEAFDQSQAVRAVRGSAPQVTRIALGLAQDAPEPWFLWVHYFDPHDPYQRHPHGDPDVGLAADYEGALEAPIGLEDLHELAGVGRAAGEARLDPDDRAFVESVYDGEIAHTDAALGGLVETLREQSRHRLLLVLTADHGEAFLDHGRFGHGVHVYQEVVRVPLVVSGDLPRSLRGLRVDTPVELASIARTLAARAGIAGAPFEGADLLDVARRPEAHAEAIAVSEGGSAWHREPYRMALVGRRWKLIHQPGVDGRDFELYDLAADPAEQRDLWTAPDPEVRPVRRALADRAFQLRAAEGAPDAQATVEIGAEEASLLRDLGYVR